jgi:hypothetical protein
MWKVFQEVLPWLLAIIVVTQIILPTLTDTPMFWMFKRKAKTKVEPTEEVKPTKPVFDHELVEEVEKAKEKVAQTKDVVKEVREKVDAHHKSAEDLKRETDSLLP